MPKAANGWVGGSLGRGLATDGGRGDRGSFPALLRAGNSNRVFGLLCDVARGVK